MLSSEGKRRALLSSAIVTENVITLWQCQLVWDDVVLCLAAGACQDEDKRATLAIRILGRPAGSWAAWNTFGFH
jgi:hypothetical protein